MITGAIRGYADNRWAGFHQIRAAGGRVRKGEKGTPVLVTRNGQARNKKNDTEPEEESQRSFYMRVHSVFNVEQTEGLDIDPVTAAAPAFQPQTAVREVADHAHVRIVHVPGDRAGYSPSQDIITMPEPAQFTVPTSYEHTLLHELAHATSHPSRLDRPAHQNKPGDRTAYALEELRAEISAMMLGEELHVGHEPRHGQAYVGSWIKALENDPNAVRKTASDAQQIVDWLTRSLDTTTRAQEPRKAA